MSGGHFNYSQYHIEDIASEIESLIETNNSTDEDVFGNEIGYHYEKETISKFEEAVKILRIAAVMAQRIDWLVSGDDGEESFHRRWDDELEKLSHNNRLQSTGQKDAPGE